MGTRNIFRNLPHVVTEELEFTLRDELEYRMTIRKGKQPYRRSLIHVIHENVSTAKRRQPRTVPADLCLMTLYESKFPCNLMGVPSPVKAHAAGQSSYSEYRRQGAMFYLFTR